MKNKKTVFILALLSILFCGWGRVGHNIINKNAALCFPSEMNSFKDWQTYLADHASDADNRKSQDPDESPKHFIDIDRYQEFVSNGAITQDFDSLVSEHGYNSVIDNGILPWAIIAAVDSLTQQFERKDWDKAKQAASDLGHYVADSHMPLHITKNYNGQYTNQYGVHSRYESDMIGKFESQIIYLPDSAVYISNVPDFVFNTIYYNYKYVDSVLNSDKTASSDANSTSSDAYYNELWNLSGKFTIQLFQSASVKIASLIYTAWTNAGKPLQAATDIKSESNHPQQLKLYQNYPNPFNPVTTISFGLPEQSHVTLRIYNIIGQEITTLINGLKKAGNYHQDFNASRLASGIYIYKITANNITISKKMILIK